MTRETWIGRERGIDWSLDGAGRLVARRRSWWARLRACWPG
jgi:hypothetical protein